MYRATDLQLGVDRAIKLIGGGVKRERSSLRRRLKDEARVMARLAHRHVLEVYDVGEDGDVDFVVMRLAGGGSLADELRAKGQLSRGRVIRVGMQMLAALEAAHAQGIVHRDVKPQNLLLDDDGTVLLADFGIALIDLPGVFRGTRTGAAMGSLAFMAPEQRVDASRVTAAADIYSVGATLYTLATGRSPMDLFVAGGDSERWWVVAPGLRTVLFRATRYAPEDRYLSATEMAAALTSLLRDPAGQTGDHTDDTWQADEGETNELGAIPGTNWLDGLGEGGSLDATGAPAQTQVDGAGQGWKSDGLPADGMVSAYTQVGRAPLDRRTSVLAGLLVLFIALLVSFAVWGPRWSDGPPPESRPDAPARVTPLIPGASDLPTSPVPLEPAPEAVVPQPTDPVARVVPRAEVSPSARPVGSQAPDTVPDAPEPGPLAVVPLGRWRLNIDGYAHELVVTGPRHSALTGTIRYRSSDGTNTVQVAIVGQYDEGQGTLVIEEQGVPQPVRYALRLQADGRFLGTATRRGSSKVVVMSHIR